VWLVALTSGERDALLTADPSSPQPEFWAISAVNELVNYGTGSDTLTNNGTTYSSDEPFGGGGNKGRRTRVGFGDAAVFRDGSMPCRPPVWTNHRTVRYRRKTRKCRYALVQ
jgi:hypothetical protein